MTEQTDIQQVIELRHSAAYLYEVLLDPTKHSSLVQVPCAIDGRVGGQFLIGAIIEGSFIELVYGQRIVQSWRINCRGWPSTHFSLVDITLMSAAHGSTLHLYQRNVPSSCAPYVEWAWSQYYWRPLGWDSDEKHSYGNSWQ